MCMRHHVHEYVCVCVIHRHMCASTRLARCATGCSMIQIQSTYIHTRIHTYINAYIHLYIHTYRNGIQLSFFNETGKMRYRVLDDASMYPSCYCWFDGKRWVCMYVCVYVCMNAYVPRIQTHICICIYIYIHTHAHAYKAKLQPSSPS